MLRRTALVAWPHTKALSKLKVRELDALIAMAPENSEQWAMFVAARAISEVSGGKLP